MDETEDIWWEGSSLDDLRQFPEEVKHAMGFQLHQVQTGEMPNDWKPLKSLGKEITGVYEIRISFDKNIFQTAHVAKFENTVAVLHCWQKKTQAISKLDLETIAVRYRSAKEALT